MSTEIVNARIRSTQLAEESHGIFTCYLAFEREGGVSQSAGGYFLDRQATAAERAAGTPERIGTAFGLTWIMELLRVLEVPTYEKLPGTVCRVRLEKGLPKAIGNFLKNQWLDGEALYDVLVKAAVEKAAVEKAAVEKQ